MGSPFKFVLERRRVAAATAHLGLCGSRREVTRAGQKSLETRRVRQLRRSAAPRKKLLFQIAVGDDVMRDEKEHVRRASSSASSKLVAETGITE